MPSLKPIPYWQSDCGRATVHVGKCEHILTGMDADQFHAVVTDPPYGLEFMGKDWDAPWKNDGKIETCDEGTDRSHPFRDGTQRVCYGSDSRRYQDWLLTCTTPILRVARPGAYMLSFGGTRMWHRMACAIEDAGFEIRDAIMWVYGSGFSKGLNVSKAIDDLHGVERTEVIAPGSAPLSQGKFNSREVGAGGYGYAADYNVMAPVTDDAKRWDGWGTTLKPAWEPIIVARKPSIHSVARNTLEYGCGGLNVGACLVGTEQMPVQVSDGKVVSENKAMTGPNTGRIQAGTRDGRIPANFIHDGSDEVKDLLHDAARFFYMAKADKDDRPHGKEATVHPTVKPLDLMCYLVRLVCARGGTVLDPFMGSGSTGCAALAEGMRFVGVEQSQEYADIAIGRLKLALQTAPDLGPVPEGSSVRNDKHPPPPRRMRGA